MSDNQRRGLLSKPPPNPPNVELAVLELAKAVIRMEAVVGGLVEKAYPQGDLSSTGAKGEWHRSELAEAKADILRALNAITGENHGG